MLKWSADTLASPVVDAPKEDEDQESCQLACLDRRPTESLQDVQLPTAVPSDSPSAHYLAPIQVPVPAQTGQQEPPLRPPQRPEHEVINMEAYHHRKGITDIAVAASAVLHVAVVAGYELT